MVVLTLFALALSVYTPLPPSAPIDRPSQLALDLDGRGLAAWCLSCDTHSCAGMPAPYLLLPVAGVGSSTRCTDDGHLHRRCAAVYHVCCCRGCTGDAGLLVCAASRHDSRRLWYARTVQIPRYTLDQIVPQIVL